MSSNPSARLNGIFQDASVSGGGNDALRYTAPREPSHKQQQQQQQAAPPAASTAAASAVVYSTMVSLYQYDASVRKYVQLGGATAGSKAAVGCVIVGAETSYNLLFYNAAKQHLCAVPVKFGSFKPTLQAKSYVNFYDDQGVNWSVKFPGDAQVAEFMLQIFLAKIHVEIWGSEKTVTKTNPSALIQDDLVFVKPETQQVSNGDTVAVTFSAWRVVGNANSAPADVVTKYAPFEKAGEGDLRKIRLGDSSERIKALEESIVGMRKGGKRIVLAPPGKTNGQDWYLLEIELMKTKTGHSATQRKSVPAANTSAVAEEAPKATSERKTSRRRSTPSSASTGGTTAASTRSNSNDRNDASRNGDLVPIEEDLSNAAAKNEMELKELRLLQREQQLELQARALERERMSVTGGGAGFGSMGFGLGGGFNSSFPSSSALFNNNALSGGRPVDALLSELNAKVDYLIRMAPGTSSSSGSGVGAGPSDVAAVVRGVERLASENDRLLTQINSQHQQQSSYEKRCEELLEQNQRLQDEKRTLQERYQSVASSQLNVSSELSALTSARDAAVTQTNRLHAEYQQLLTAYYQLQQQQGASNEAEEHKQALNFEREARARAEKQLAKETQARSLAEQELSLTKKQHDVALQVKTSELSAASAQMEQQVRTLQAQLQKANDDRVRLQTYAEEQAQRLAAQSESKERDVKQQLERAGQQIAQLQQETHDLTGKLDVSSARVQELESELELKAAIPETSTEEVSALAAEEKRIFVEQIELLQQKVKDLEQEKYEQVQQALESGRLSSPGPSPRGQKKAGFEGDCESCATVKDREQAAERALAAAEAIKREAQDMLAVAAHTGGGADERERLVALFKESVNEMFFRFQDLFEEETAVDGKQVLTAIRKVLKSSTKSIIQQLQEPAPQQEAGAEAESDGNISDGPPAPPPQDTPVVQAAAAVEAVAETIAAVEAVVAPADEERHAGDSHDAEEKSTPTIEVASTAEKPNASVAEAKVEVETETAPRTTSVDVPEASASAASAPVLHVARYPSSDESDSDSDFQG
ncbi:unnamed protein product [Phytophthora fragariaefolia]|uniref:Unnamed protein product n=1 Tax=Phytophthora fragariaefolia TaxID=1490495 RepID=A0A9W7CUM9_9STRA|nr:unnamed protein product [Phytophthora fragariaefolia]